MSKAADAFRTISEVADELDVPKHVLRFWEAKFSHIRPMKRGGGRRYYRPEDLELLRGIRHLLHLEGLTIKGVQKILRDQGVDGVKRWGRADAEDLSVVAPPVMAPMPVAPAEMEAPAARVPRRKAKPVAADAAHEDAGSGKRRLPPELVAAVRVAIAELEKCRDILDGRGSAAPSSVPQGGTPAARRLR